ncbi:uncharacterized protein F4822DRAFT_81154 [Hypoxylon trugodes]|uniref:uncharacterized protein n=1 Tax=Hypoxylon trugodes TaxID=326681 RepID=UPI00218CCA67|nr:uncharacterized protein F4822DRAFT_81154 [Hypoxylon trugodes]KAI1383563.1 hypothetical protein F4822DRAFT_81154 [Hypoxylon trugodes]
MILNLMLQRVQVRAPWSGSSTLATDGGRFGGHGSVGDSSLSSTQGPQPSPIPPFSHSHTSTLHANPNQHYRCLLLCFLLAVLILLLSRSLTLSTLTLFFPSLPLFSPTLINVASPILLLLVCYANLLVACVLQKEKNKSVFLCARGLLGIPSSPIIILASSIASSQRFSAGFISQLSRFPSILVAAQVEL